MSYLTGPEIEQQILLGNIQIDPFEPDFVGPNSVDLRLHEDIRVYDTHQHDRYSMGGGYYIDLGEGADPPPLIPARREDDGSYLLRPGELYLARTVEVVGSGVFVPMVEGRSSLGRVGVQVHMTAGVGDLGFLGTFTLEIAVVLPVRIVPGVRVCQVLFNTVQGDHRGYTGRYQGQVDPTASRLTLPGYLPSGSK